MIPRADDSWSRFLEVPTAHLLMQIRHNLVVGEKPFFRRGGCVLKTAYHLEKDENIRLFWMRRLRLGSALAGALGCMALSVAAGAALWPHAREAATILAAKDDPGVLSDIHINSALRTNQALVADHIEAALAEGDSDLANSFVELARDKGIAVDDELLRRVAPSYAAQLLISSVVVRASVKRSFAELKRTSSPDWVASKLKAETVCPVAPATIV